MSNTETAGQVADGDFTVDRPGIADSPYLVAAKSWQVESGLNYSKNYDIESIYIPAVLVRKRLASRLEGRLNINYAPQKISLIDYSNANNLTMLGLGGKFKFAKEKGVIPDAAIIANAFYPIERLENASDYHLGGDFYFAFQNHLNKRISLNYNLGYLITYYHPYALNFSFCGNFALDKRVGLFIEYFSFSHKLEALEVGLDAGLVIHLWKNTQLDFSYIKNFVPDGDFSFWAVGFSFNIPNTK